MTKPLRKTMPFTTAIIDDFRANYPEACPDAAIKAGIAGQPTFWARENGVEIGTKAHYDAQNSVPLTDVCLGPLNRPTDPQKGK